jgi:tRNA(Ile2) C34 agmatinyltransferase TiaS
MRVRTHNLRFELLRPEPVVMAKPYKHSVKCLRKYYTNQWEILKSYKATSVTIPSTVADELLKRGVSRGERVCSKCFKIMPDEGKWRCRQCRAEAKIVSSKNYIILRAKYHD